MSEMSVITVLVDDSTRCFDLDAEHGLALPIRAGSTSVLFDTGQCGLLESNACLLGIDLSRIGAVIRCLTQARPIRMVIGGFHPLDGSANRIERTMESLWGLGVQKAARAHCTGGGALARPRHVFGPGCANRSVGRRSLFQR